MTDTTNVHFLPIKPAVDPTTDAMCIRCDQMDNVAVMEVVREHRHSGGVDLYYAHRECPQATKASRR